MTAIKRAAYGSVSGLMAGMLGGLVAGFLFGLVMTTLSVIGSGELEKWMLFYFLGNPMVGGLIIGSILGLVIGVIVPRPSYRLLNISQLLGGFITVVPSLLLIYLVGSIIFMGILILVAFIAGMVGGTVAGRFYQSIFS